MRLRQTPLNDAQLTVLRWIEDSCPAGVFDDWSHRSSAKALSNRGLVSIEGHGVNWHAELTEDGVYYLEHGEYPNHEPIDNATKAIPEDTTNVSTTSTKMPPIRMHATSKRKTQRVGPTQQMMIRLAAAGVSGITVPHTERRTYGILIGIAKRYNKIPKGMRITTEDHWEDGNWMLTVALEPLPAWQTRVLPSVTVPTDLDNASPVTLAFKDSGTFPVKGEPRERALLIIEALVTEADARGMKTKAKVNVTVLEGGDAYRSERHDEVEFVLGRDRYRVWFVQKMLRRPHVPTRSEISWAWRGSSFPISTRSQTTGCLWSSAVKGGTFFSDRWEDGEERSLEKLLPQILEEMCLRHQRMEHVRVEQEEETRRRRAEREAERERLEREAKELRTRRDAARRLAVDEYKRRKIIETMRTQAECWRTAELMRSYADAIEISASAHDDGKRRLMEQWADDIRRQAALDDPLSATPSCPVIPEPVDADLEPLIMDMIGDPQ